MKKRAKTGWIFLFAVVFLFMMYVLIQYFVVSPKNSGVVQGKLAIPKFPFNTWLVVLYTHIIAGSIAFVIGPFQFLKRPVGKIASRHRKWGYVYVLSILLAGLAGIYLCVFATGGTVSGLGFFMLDVLWLSTTGMAVVKVKQKKFASHRRWMIRSYAVTLAFVTFRLYLLPFTLVLGLNIENGIRLASWLAWITNLLIVEVYFKRKSVKQQASLSMR
ncbi:DUF2306 domain-containing protein [Neobacillus sp. Marseille-QA0830]